MSVECTQCHLTKAFTVLSACSYTHTYHSAVVTIRVKCTDRMSHIHFSALGKFSW